MTTPSGARARVGVPFLDLRAQDRALWPSIRRRIEQVWLRSRFILGPEVAACEARWARACGAREAVGVASGTAGLQLALLALGIGPGDEVIAPAFTAVPTVMAIAGIGARPVLADVEAATLTLDPASVARRLTRRTRAVIVVHLYGQPADLHGLRRVIGQRPVVLIEDAAQAHGARYRGHAIGTIGRIGVFSCYPTKNLGAYGDAGLVVTSDRALARRIRWLRHCGQSRWYEHPVVGLNARLDELQAAILNVKLPQLGRWVQQRRRLAQRYRRALHDLPLLLPPELPGRQASYHLYVIRTPRREALRRALQQAGIETMVHYPTPIHRQSAYRFLSRSGGFPVAERAARTCLSLPLYAGMPPSHQERVIKAIRAFFSRSS